MFSECHISLNGRQISSESNYAYKTYLQSMLFHSKSSQKNFLSTGMFYKDTPDAFDDTDPTATGKNKGLQHRFERLQGGGEIFDMCGMLHTDLGTTLNQWDNNPCALVKSKRQFQSLSENR
ncbi:uncharacterized protein F54H12.2 [Nephila pilipes]|uniref:Uncharacterized protein F54H12.2 n=1 Tax=Nephila pilipes TaxID=299642 RepID=A0A8X6TUN2_NEPPI|nr:uncharacterized protein F54H12.2 [Nephila pilipes]